MSFVVNRTRALLVKHAKSKILARFAERRDWLTSLAGNGLGRRSVDRQIGRPAIGKNLPGSSGLAYQDDQIFSPLFAALAHGDGNEHFAATQVDGDLTQHLNPHRFHFHVTQSSLEQCDQKFTDGGQTAHRRNAGTDQGGIGSVEFEQVVNVPGVAGLGPILDNLAGACFGTAAGRARQTGSTSANRGGLSLGRRPAGRRSRAWNDRALDGIARGGEMMIVVVKVMLPTGAGVRRRD